MQHFHDEVVRVLTRDLCLCENPLRSKGSQVLPVLTLSQDMTLIFLTARFDESRGVWLYKVSDLTRTYTRKWLWIDLVRVDGCRCLTRCDSVEVPSGLDYRDGDNTVWIRNPASPNAVFCASPAETSC